MNEFAAQAEQFSFAIEGDFEVPILVALLHCRQEMLAAVLDPFDRTAQPQTGGRERDFLRIHDELCTEAAADVGRDDAKLVLVELEQPHQKGPHLVRELRRRPQRQPVLVDVIDGNGAAAFDRVRTAAVLLETDPRPMRRPSERRGDVAVGLTKLHEQIARLAAMRDRGTGV